MLWFRVPGKVYIKKGCLPVALDELKTVMGKRRAFLVTDSFLYKNGFAKPITDKLDEMGIAHACFFNVEPDPTLACAKEGAKAMNSFQPDCIIALGGGVTGDISGFAAATYQRGMEFVQIPTTLLSAVDSSVGGKTAVNLPKGKNQVGSFYQPSLVICDPELLSSLPEAEFACGCAEVIKYAMLGSPEFFEQLEALPVRSRLEDVICRCVEMKRDIVAQDEFDRGLRQLLNLGHSVGHAVEACSGFSLLHGQAVSIGMAVITRAAVEMGFCPRNSLDRLLSLLRACGLPTETEYTLEQLLPMSFGPEKLS